MSWRKRKTCAKLGCTLVSIHKGDVSARCDKCLSIYHPECADLDDSNPILQRK